MDCFTIHPWEIETRTASPETKDYRESIFSQGNGYMGVRGYSPIGSRRNDAERTTFFSGFFEYIRPGITDMVNQPDFAASRLSVGGIDVNDMEVVAYRQTLDMRDGTVLWTYTAADQENRRTRIRITRFLSMEDNHAAAIRFELMPENHDSEIILETGIDGNVINLPIADNQLSDNLEFARMWGRVHVSSKGRQGRLFAETAYSKRRTVMEYHLQVSEGCGISVEAAPKKRYTGSVIRIPGKQGRSYVIDKLICAANYRDGEDAGRIARVHMERGISLGFDGMLLETRKAWQRIWESCDVEVEASGEIQGAIRYNILQLIQSDPADDPHASIGARGLMHGRYKGCYFWDTEIFMLPLFLHTRPEAAKNLLLYRYHTLKDALESAGRFSLKGARYSWMSSDTGFEQCETWDTGCCEIHITADIAYAVGRYIRLTGDRAFHRDYGAEIYIQTARYWMERFTYDRGKDCYNLLYVKGPDEYCGVTMNNFYTVKLALHNLTLALDSVGWMEKEYPAEWKSLKEKLEYRAEEAKGWQELLQKAVTYYDEERKLWIQDPVFESLEPIEISAYKEDNIPLYHKLSFDRLQRYQVLKQSDVLMYMALFPEEMSKEQMLAAWNYYEPKTLHDSTLSFGIHALLAARLGIGEAAWEYFFKSLFLDLKNVMGNTAGEGIHTAALGATWQALIFGFAGIWTDAGGIKCKPNLPEEIHKMKFKLCYENAVYEIGMERGKEPRITFLQSI
ncbi:trehalose/maltose hydrolase-like predicted phosphorylase [Anaerotaenia torta]|uniref:glycoside hydrolase family 65 protein n=1 Tax=Anaerotaenia torta TaxID=433293 RepID=UPI003D1A4CB6